MNDTDRLKNRVAELEFQVTHMQRAYDQLNEVVTEQANLMDRMQHRIKSLESLVGELKKSTEPSTDPLDEKPPHY